MIWSTSDPEMNHACRYAMVVSGLVILCTFYLPVLAVPSQQLQPVDQAVGDLDPLSVSMRRIEVGLRIDGEQTSLFKTVGRDSQFGEMQYYRIGPGFTARVNRMDYLVLRDGGRRSQLDMNIAPRVDGEFLELIPADTLFEIQPLDPHASSYPLTFEAQPRGRALGPVRTQWRIDNAVDTRIDLRINRRINTDLDRRHWPDWRRSQASRKVAGH